MKSFLRQVSWLAGMLAFFALSVPAAEIALSGVDPTVILTTNPPVFTFTVDRNGFFTNEYLDASGFTFLNLKITGPANGITNVGCAPGTVFQSCSATIDIAMNLVTFLFGGGNGIANNQAFFLTATNFVGGQTLVGTSTLTVPTNMPEPATIFPMLGVFGLAALVMARRKLLKFRIGS